MLADRPPNFFLSFWGNPLQNRNQNLLWLRKAPGKVRRYARLCRTHRISQGETPGPRPLLVRPSENMSLATHTRAHTENGETSSMSTSMQSARNLLALGVESPVRRRSELDAATIRSWPRDFLMSGRRRSLPTTSKTEATRLTSGLSLLTFG